MRRCIRRSAGVTVTGRCHDPTTVISSLVTLAVYHSGLNVLAALVVSEMRSYITSTFHHINRMKSGEDRLLF